MITIDGSMGEGGGQVLRSSLALSLLTGTPLRIENIRAGRARPGLMRQHLVAVRAAAAISGADVSGDELGSTGLELRPGAVRGGDYAFAIGGAGSTTLVFQTVLLPLLLGAEAPSSLRFEGGTHNPMAPPFDFLSACFLPQLARMGADVRIGIERHGFYPAGGGSWSASVEPLGRLGRLELLERGRVLRVGAAALCAGLSGSIGVRQSDVLAQRLGWERERCSPRMVSGTRGPGNALIASIESEHVTEQITGFGERGVSAESIAEQVAVDVQRYLAAGVPVGEHLADQLLLPMALGEGGSLRTVAPSLHCRTQLTLLQLFLGVSSTVTEESADVWRIDVPGIRFGSDLGRTAVDE
jgi:RNA 3'-terminal phosphate cyclase (ATP)